MPTPLNNCRFTYLAQPYSHLDPHILADRAELGGIAAAWLMQRGWAVHAPVVQGHNVCLHLPSALAHDHAFWMDRDMPILASAQAMHVLPIAGWRDSRGLKEELGHAKDLHLPVYIMQSLPYGFMHRIERVSVEELHKHGWKVES